MPKFLADEYDEKSLTALLRERKQLKHLRVRRRGNMLTIESGPKSDPYAHARMRKDAASLWILEMPSHSRWQATPFRQRMEPLLDLLVGSFGWTLAPID